MLKPTLPAAESKSAADVSVGVAEEVPLTEVPFMEPVGWAVPLVALLAEMAGVSGEVQMPSSMAAGSLYSSPCSSRVSLQSLLETL